MGYDELKGTEFIKTLIDGGIKSNFAILTSEDGLLLGNKIKVHAYIDGFKFLNKSTESKYEIQKWMQEYSDDL